VPLSLAHRIQTVTTGEMTRYSCPALYEQALADYTIGIRLHLRDAFAYTNRGMLYLDLKEYRLALADFDQALLLNLQEADATDGRERAWQEIQKQSYVSCQEGPQTFSQQARGDHCPQVRG